MAHQEKPPAYLSNPTIRWIEYRLPIFSTLDPRVLQFKPGILKTHELCAELLDRVEASIGEARQEVKGLSTRRAA